MCDICDGIKDILPTLFEGACSPAMVRRSAVNHMDSEKAAFVQNATDEECHVTVMLTLISYFVETGTFDIDRFIDMLSVAVAQGESRRGERMMELLLKNPAGKPC